MKNYTRPGYIRTAVVSADFESGQPRNMGTRAGISCGSYKDTEEGEFVMGGVFEFAKSGIAIVAGTVYDWDATAKEVVAGGAGDFELGEADAGAVIADETCMILVNSQPYAYN